MSPSLFVLVVAVLVLFDNSSAISILLGNDDGFASAQSREFYRLLKASGHEVILVAPAENESGQAGRVLFTSNSLLATNSEFDLVQAGEPSIGRDPTDTDIWYYNGTPIACTYAALDYIIPSFYGNRSVDLYVAGPNFGSNLGYFYYTLSGTIASTYAAIQRNIPGIAFSGANNEQRSYQWINKTTASGYSDPATIQAELATALVNHLVDTSCGSTPILPLGYGLNVNSPYITSLSNNSCINPPFVQTRLGGGAIVPKAVFNATSGIFSYSSLVTEGDNVCINGDCTLPGETSIVDNQCYSAVSVFTVDYDAAMRVEEHTIRNALQPLVRSVQPSAQIRLK